MRIFLSFLILFLWMISLRAQRSDDHPSRICQTSDGGYAVLSRTNKTGAGSFDFYFYKVDGLGAYQWGNTYGGSNTELPSRVICTKDGGFLLSGTTRTIGVGSDDLYLIKVNAIGNVEWSKSYGGVLNDIPRSLIENPDGSFWVSGNTNSFGFGLMDVFLIKLNASGVLLSANAWGTSSDDRVTQMKLDHLGRLWMIGYTEMNNNRDAFILRTDQQGVPVFQKVFGLGGEEECMQLYPIQNGILAAGWTDSYGVGDQDIFLMRMDSTGDVNMLKGFGENGNESPGALMRLSSGEIYLSNVRFDAGLPGEVFYFLKTDSQGKLISAKQSVDSLRSFGTFLSESGGKILAGGPSLHNASGDWAISLLEPENGHCSLQSSVPDTFSMSFSWWDSLFLSYVPAFQSDSGVTVTAVATPLEAFHACIEVSVEEELLTQKLKLFPQPCRTYLRIQHDLLFSDWARVEVLDLHGKIVFSRASTPNNPLDVIPVAGLRPGIYALRIHAKAQVISKKFIKQ